MLQRAVGSGKWRLKTMRPMTLLPLLPVLHCVFAPANALEVRGAAPGSCHDATATTLKISWAEEPETDMYYVQLTDTAASDSMPYALQTAATASITLIDLVPDTEYTLSVRSHPSVFNIVWGWRPAGPTFTCKTTPEHVGAPRQLQRVGERPHASEIAVRWRPAQVIGATSNPAHSVGVRVAAEAGARNDSRWNWEKADNATAHTVRNLASGQLYEVAIRDDTSGVVSESLLMRTAAPGVLYTNAYRISEYTFDGANCSTFSRLHPIRMEASATCWPRALIILLHVEEASEFRLTAPVHVLAYLFSKWIFWITMTLGQRNRSLFMFKMVVATQSSMARKTQPMDTGITLWMSASRHWSLYALPISIAEPRSTVPVAQCVIPPSRYLTWSGRRATSQSRG